MTDFLTSLISSALSEETPPSIEDVFTAVESPGARPQVSEYLRQRPHVRESIHVLVITFLTSDKGDRQDPSMPVKKQAPSTAAEQSATLEKAAQNGNVDSFRTRTRRHLIRIVKPEDRPKALAAFRGIRESRTRFPNDIMGVGDDHVRALERERISFEYVSKDPHEQPRKAPPSV